MAWLGDEDEKQKIKKLDRPLRAALDSLSNFLSKLEQIEEQLPELGDLDEEEASYVYRLILQLRLNNENVLKNIMRANKALCLALGMEENASLRKNIDSAISQLGFDNFYGEFSILGHLVDKLSKALARTEQIKQIQQEEKELFEKLARQLAKDEDYSSGRTKKKGQKPPRRGLTRLADELRAAIGLQSYFSLCIEQMTEAYHAIPGLPKFGIIYDYLAGIKSPVEHSFELVMRGNVLSKGIMSSLSKHLGYKPQDNFNHLIHQVNKSLDKLAVEQKHLLHDYVNQKKNLEQMVNQNKETNEKKANLEQSWKKSALNLFNR